MAHVVLIDWSGYPSIGLQTLNKAMQRNGIDSRVIKIPMNIPREIGSLPRIKRKERTQEIINKAMHYILRHSAINGVKIIGMPMYDWHGQMRWEGHIIEKLRTTFPKAKIIGGGPAFNSNPKGFFAQLKLDYAIRGEAEHALPQLIKILEGRSNQRIEEVPGIIMQKKGRIIMGQAARLTNYEIAYSKIPLVRTKSGIAYTLTQRGCAKACIFCAVPRKGQPAEINESSIITALIKLARNKKIKAVSFHDDQLFSNRERSKRIFEKIIELGLHKRFSFSGLATIDSFIQTQNGRRTVDTELIALLKQANFYRLEIGTEALSDGMLTELKSGRYNSIEAMKVIAELTRAGIKTYNFLLAGGVNTKPIDFLESYYRTLTKDTRRMQETEEYANMQIIHAYKGTTIYTQAAREGCLVDERGRKAGVLPERRMGVRFVVPKDPTLQKMFIEQIRNGQLDFNADNIRQVILLGERLSQTDTHAAKLTQRLKQTKYRMQIMIRDHHRKTNQILPHILAEELAKKGKELDEKTVERFNNSKGRFEARIYEKAKRFAALHNAGPEWMKGMPAQQRLQTLKRQREKMGFGATIPKYILKSYRKKH